jgi:hypothetical protein
MNCVHVATATQEEKVLPFSFKYSAFAPSSTSPTDGWRPHTVKAYKGCFFIIEHEDDSGALTLGMNIFRLFLF